MATTSARLPKVTQSLKKLLDYAEEIRQNHPKIWKKGGNIQGNDSYDTLKKIVHRGKFEEEDRDFVQTWNAWKARHLNHTNIEGMVASLKWLAVPEAGLREMKKVINEEIKKEK